ncbi:hypothetical protein ACFFGT_19065 [Mucilaginibacter angelicae]|uniref:Outer membrane protein beta-barrel domain-containing protein n=1 Tax=Mucilaginibacter angelicae TaxID=869718 RepID=A0ABV6LA29_9SPHI
MIKPIHFLLTVLFIAFSFIAQGQRGNQTSLSVGTELDVPLNIGSYQYSGNDITYKGGFGVNLKLETPITQALHFTAGAGYIYFESNRYYLYSVEYSSSQVYPKLHPGPYVYLPVVAGLKYYWAKYFYVSAETGCAFKTNNKSYNSFIYSGGAGAVVPIGPHHGLDFGVRFERGYKNIDYNHPIDQLGLNVAYKYRF